MNITAEGIAIGLGGRKEGNNWVCPCPAHEDKSPSLNVTQGHSTILLKCRSGCHVKDVIKALGELGLWYKRGAKAKRGFISNSDLFEMFLFVKIAENEKNMSKEDILKVESTKIKLNQNNYGMDQARQTLKRLTLELRA